MAGTAALLSTIANALPEPVLIFSSRGRLEALNEAAGLLTGLAPPASGAVTLAELLGDRAAAAEVLADREGNAGARRPIPFLLTFYAPGGRPAKLRGERWRISAGKRSAVGLRLREPEALQHRRVLSRIAEGLTAARSRPAAECQATGLASTISEICAFTGWAYAEVWLPGEGEVGGGRRGAPWAAHPFWYGSRERYSTFRKLSMKAAAGAPLPLVNRVANEQSALWFSDVSAVPLAVYRRARAAREAGLRATFAQPIVEAGRTLGVLVFMMSEARARDDALAGLMSEAARQLAPLFRLPERQGEQVAAAVPRRLAGLGADERMPRDMSLLCRLLDGLGTPAAIIVQEDRSIAWANAPLCRTFGYALEDLIGTSTVRLHVDQDAFEEFGQRALPLVNAGKPFRQRFRVQRKDGARFASEHLIVPLGQIGGQRLLVSLVTDLSESLKLAFGRRVEQLSAREQEVFQLTVIGATVTEIAHRLGLSVRTVEAHRSHMLHKLGCPSTTKLLAELLADSLVERTRP